MLCGTLAPVAIRVPLLSDKIEHFLAFLVLALLGLGAFGRKNVVALALALAAIGGLIEVLQGLRSLAVMRNSSTGLRISLELQLFCHG